MDKLKRLTVLSFGEYVEKLELLCSASWNVKWYVYFGKQFSSFLEI